MCARAAAFSSNTYAEDGLAGATLELVSTASNTVTITLGIMPTGITIASGTANSLTPLTGNLHE